jgi:diguanylate cyclase (GGDEF)-like protein/PAS domain S-box-containing protein
VTSERIALPGRRDILPRGRRGLRVSLATVVAALMVAYGLLYLGWQLFRWGGPDLELVIADAAFLPLGILGVGFALLAARHARERAGRRAWIVIALAFGAYLAGDALWFWLEVVLGTQPYPSIADAGYLAFYPLLLLGLPRERPENPLRTLLDIAIVVVGAGTVVWWLILEPIAAANASGGIEALVALAYPVGDLLVLFALAATLMSRLVGTSRVALGLLGIGLALNVVADLSYARLSLEETYTSGGWLDACYLVGWVLIGLAGFQQARSTIDARKAGLAPVQIHPVSFPPYVAVAAVYALLLVATEMQGSSLRVVVAGAILVTGMVVLRQVLTARENARLLADRASSRSAARFGAIIQNASDVILVVDRTGTIGYVTPSVTRLVGRPAASLPGLAIDALLAPDDAPLALELLRTAAARPGTSDTIAGRVPTLTGAFRHIEMSVTNLLDDPVVEGLVVTIRDVTERREFEDQLRNQAFHDPLTGLANRALIADRIDHAVRRSRRRSVTPALLYLDLDDFKKVNDSLGHPIGDRVLVEVARRLGTAIRVGDTAARLGGDEFAVLVEETSAVDEAVAVADRILAELRPPIDIDGTVVVIGASVGIVRPEGDDGDPSDLLRDADIAMYEAKREARGGYRVFEHAMFAATVERVNLESDLRAALEAGQFELVYQPLFDLSDHRLSGVEALLRWNHPTRGLVMPLDFIPLAERTGEIVPIGRWVIEGACTAVAGWNRMRDTAELRANVNVSARQLEPRLVGDVADILARTGFPARLLVLEITESVFAAERPGVLEVLGSLRALGVRISIDDFGTGYSSLSMLRDLPVDELKIDRSFIETLTNHGDTALVEAIIKLSHDFDLATVAEGIEMTDQVDSLRELGCDVGQGYLLGRPVSAATIEDGIRETLARADALPRSA